MFIRYLCLGDGFAPPDHGSLAALSLLDAIIGMEPISADRYMKRDEMADLTAFAVVAEERVSRRRPRPRHVPVLAEPARASCRERLGLRLLTRTTRSVAATDAGERAENAGPALDELDASLAALSSQQHRPAGTIRITSVEHAAKAVIWPVLKTFTRDYPDISVEFCWGTGSSTSSPIDSTPACGSASGDKDMIAVRRTHMPMAVVGAPAYFARTRLLETHEKAGRPCVPDAAATDVWRAVFWPFEKDGRQLKVQVRGPWFSTPST